jgi:hypothetical protein
VGNHCLKIANKTKKGGCLRELDRKNFRIYNVMQQKKMGSKITISTQR